VHQHREDSCRNGCVAFFVRRESYASCDGIKVAGPDGTSTLHVHAYFLYDGYA